MSSVAVVMPVHNGGAYVTKAAESILGQTFADFEFVVVDDGSSDGSDKLIEDLARRDPRIRPLRQDHAGVAAALNAGIRSTDAEFIVRMDADDIAANDRIERQLNFLLQNPDIAVVGSFVNIMDAAGNFRKLKKFPVTPEEISARRLHKNPMCHSSVVMRRAAYEAAGGYDERFKSAQDHDLWLRVSHLGYRLANMPVPLLQYRDHPGQVTASGRRQQTYIFSSLAILQALFAAHGLPRFRFDDMATFDFDQLATRIIALAEVVTAGAERDAMYYQAARLVRFYSEQKGIARLAKALARRALRDRNASFLVRRFAYRFI